MEESTFGLMTGLCSALVADTFEESLVKERIVKKLRSQAFEIVLNHRHTKPEDDVENNPEMLVVDILGHVYWKAKANGDWNKDMMDDVNYLIEKAETLAKHNSSVASVLKLLLCLADNTLTRVVQNEEPCYGLDMKLLISDHDLKHKSLVKSPPVFSSEIFELPASESSEHVQRLQTFNESPGIGLKYQQFFVLPTPSLNFELGKLGKYDDLNANWVSSQVQNMNIQVRHRGTDSRVNMHPDEGYVTPDQDLVNYREHPYIPWEDLYKNDFHLIHSWDSYGGAVVTKEPPFTFQNRDAIEPICKLFYASDVTSSLSKTSVPLILRMASIEELEVALKNLLVGVESSVFQYDDNKESFVLQRGLCLKGLTAITFDEYCEDFIECGNRFKQLSKVTKLSPEYGLVFQTLCNCIRQYLQCYRGVVLRMPAMQSLLGVRHWLHKLSTQMQFLISLCAFNVEVKGKPLLTHLYDQAPLLNRQDLSFLYYYIMQSCCSVYFRFLSKWIFEGVIDNMWQEEFFIKCNPLNEDMYNEKFWEQGFELDNEVIPSFLREFAGDLMLCGKSMALLKLCAIEDPICKQVKKDHPEITYCFNKVTLERAEEQIKSYSENCKAQCQLLFGLATPEPHNDDYYAGVRTKALNEIKVRQEEERRLKTEKRLVEFNALKKEMEDAKARKIEEKIILLKEEEKLLGESEKIEHLNDLRREEERQKLIQFYSSLSETADLRIKRAEWKIKRAELHEKRCEFFNKEKKSLQETLQFEHNKTAMNRDTKILLSERSLEKYLETYNSSIQTIGDHIASESIDEKPPLQEDINRSSQHTEVSNELSHGDHLDLNVDCISKLNKLNYFSENVTTENDDIRDWLIALDVADQAKQSALKFKQRNMHNDYNILTGEEATFESRFGKKLTLETKHESVPAICSVGTNDSAKGNEEVISEVTQSESVESESNHFETNTGEVMTAVDDESCTDFPSITATNPPTNFHEFSNFSDDKSNVVFNLIQDTTLSTTSSENGSSFDDIDVTTMHSNLQRSVSIPLMKQLELTNDAIVRLFFKHNLLQHMECIWKYFFLMEGEFARNLTKNLFQEAQKVQHPIYLLNVIKLNSILRCATGTNVDEEFTERLSFYVKKVPTVFRSLDPNMLDCLSLRYKTYWPINIIITEELIIKQDSIFKYLLKLHRMSWALEEDIYLLKDKKLFSSKEYRKVQFFRHTMTHFITSVKKYITAVALESTWLEFKKDFTKAKTVDRMNESYRRYIKIVSSRCLLEKARQQVEQPYNRLFTAVLTFHEVLRSSEWIQDSATGCYRHSNFLQLNSSFNEFRKMANKLAVSFQTASQYYPNIVQLSTMLSFNDFYLKNIVEGEQ